MRHAWTVVVQPRTDNLGKNKGGLVVALTDGDASHEVSRVAYVRRNSKNPDVEFGDQLDAEIEKAQRAADAVNDYLDELERAEDERVVKAREKVREILGREPRANAKPS